MLTEKAIERLIRQRIFLWDEPDDPAEWRIGGISEAAAAIAKRLSEGVVWVGKLPAWRGRNRSPGMSYAKGVGVPDLPHHLLDKELTVIVLDKQGEQSKSVKRRLAVQQGEGE